MSSAGLHLRPGLAAGLYPERRVARSDWADRQTAAIASRRRRWNAARLDRLAEFACEVRSLARPLEDCSDAAFGEQVRELRAEFARAGAEHEQLSRAFALVREAARRTLGTPHYDVQLMGGWIMARGMLAEMATGEGKTLTATLPACHAALTGTPVHVISANDYLVARDAREMAPLYEALGLRVGVVTESLRDPVERAAQYACDVTYVTGKGVAFDYLRDHLRLGRHISPLSLRLAHLTGRSAEREGLLLRGLCFGLIDEADHVLIDEARTPLILSRPAPASLDRGTYRRALQLARELLPERDFRMQSARRRLELTDTGRQRLAGRVERLGAPWNEAAHREEWITKALRALYLFERDRHYLVQDEKVAIIDQPTGRLAADRSWEQGLHQLIEVKEGCPVTPEKETLARISVQQFYRRYLRLAGMTGTAREVAGELWSVYGLDTVAIPTRKPSRKRRLATRVFPSAEEKWSAVEARIEALNREGRPVLVGTTSVEASETLAERLVRRQLRPQVLNARQDSDEAQQIAQAGQTGQITISTAMAGRGTDIRLGHGIAEAGGLHVIATELAEARRIDRQLFGRCGRQGEPGSYEQMLSLDDDAVVRWGPAALRSSLRASYRWSRKLGNLLAKMLIHAAQFADESRYAQMRRELLEHEDRLEDLIAFSGR